MATPPKDAPRNFDPKRMQKRIERGMNAEGLAAHLPGLRDRNGQNRL
jgi:hypothetical protein